MIVKYPGCKENHKLESDRQDDTGFLKKHLTKPPKINAKKMKQTCEYFYFLQYHIHIIGDLLLAVL